MTAYLSARKINKSFLFGGNKIGILSELDFDIREGEFVSILGSSGCGKSTLLELFAGITRPDNGSILLCGDDITGQSGHLGYMPQEDLLFPWLSTEQNVLLPARIKKRDLAQARAEIKRLLPVFGKPFQVTTLSAFRWAKATCGATQDIYDGLALTTTGRAVCFAGCHYQIADAGMVTTDQREAGAHHNPGNTRYQRSYQAIRQNRIDG